MLELTTVLALVACTFVLAVVPWTAVLAAGVLTTGAGLVLGLSTGLWYHVALSRALTAKRALAPRWWLRPASLHEHLDVADRRGVMPWFYAGAAGFCVTVAGIALIALGMAVGVWRTL